MKKLIICTGIFLSGAVANAESVTRVDQLNCSVGFHGQNYTMMPETSFDNNKTLVAKAIQKISDSKIGWVEASVTLGEEEGFLLRQFIASVTTSDASGERKSYATIEIPDTNRKNKRSILSNGVATISCTAK